MDCTTDLDSLARFFEAGRATWNQLSFLSQREMAVLSYYTPEKAQALLQYTESLGQKVITPDDEEYPESLRHLEDAPAVLYALGRTTLMQEELCIGMMGTRKASENGKKAARFLARDLAEEGAVIVSGGAMGIDTGRAPRCYGGGWCHHLRIGMWNRISLSGAK